MFCVLTFPLQKQITHIYNIISVYVLAVLEPALVIGPVVGAFFLLLYTVVIAIIAIAMTKKYKGQFSPVITKTCHVLLHVHTKLVKSSNLCAMHLALRVLEDQMLHALLCNHISISFQLSVVREFLLLPSQAKRSHSQAQHTSMHSLKTNA